uniref:Uncharacterized protein n=2 Tax=Varanus komodoensis TaxID=61221 RepID=A0A8D2IPX6_VARKO
MVFIRSLLDTIEFIILLIYYLFEAFVLKFFCIKKNVTGQIVLVTGSAKGIGREIALSFARLGAILVLWDINEDDNKETSELVESNGALAVYTYKCDVSDREEIYRVAEQVKKEVGNVNILINNAGILNGKDFLDLQDADMEKTIAVNTEAHFWTCKAFLPAMIACNDGHLVSISSGAALVGAVKLSDYTARKAAAFGFLETVSFELWASGKKGIKTTIVCPGFVDTQLTTGLTIKRPLLFPHMDVAYTGKWIVDAILKEKFYAFMPASQRFIPLKL